MGELKFLQKAIDEEKVNDSVLFSERKGFKCNPIGAGRERKKS